MARFGIKSKSFGLLLILMLGVSVMLMIKPVESTSWIWENGIAPLPEVNWENPKRSLTYNTSMPLEFNITYPRPENFAVGSDMYFLHIIEYSIDGANATSVEGQYYQDNTWSSGQIELDTSRISNGLHNITVTAYFTVLWANIGSPTDQPYIFPQTSFQIDNQITTPTPIVPEFSIAPSLILVLASVTLLLVIGKRKLTVMKNMH